MWHEVRKQERKIRCMIVDYKRRAERRKDYYEKIKADPTQFLQIHGRPCKIHLDPAVAMAGDSPANMMTWQGSPDVIIDRFDVRAHLDFIPDYKPEDDEPLSYEDRHINYERYRILVQNEFLGGINCHYFFSKAIPIFQDDPSRFLFTVRTHDIWRFQFTALGLLLFIIFPP